MKKIFFLTIMALGIHQVAALAQAPVSPLDSATKYFEIKDYKKALPYYELAIKGGNEGNYTFYRASQSACQIGETQKSITYGLRSFAKFQDFNNYLYFSTDTLNSCFRSSPEAAAILSDMKSRYDAAQAERKQYIEAIRDTTLRINSSPWSEDHIRAATKGKDAKHLTAWIKGFNNYPVPPKKEHWTLYHIKVRDTMKVPFLLYVPRDYDPSKKHFLYVYLHGAAGNRPQFSVNSNIPKSEAALLQKPLLENAIIIYAFGKREFNWLYHQDAFEAIEREIILTKSLYNIDDNRVYVGGHSDGGRGAFWFATHRPSAFASWFGVCYFPSSFIDNTHLSNLGNQGRFYGISASDDTLFPASMVKQVWSYANAKGANWDFIELNGEHSLPEDSPKSTFFVYDKFFSQLRDPFPKRVAWETDNVKNGRNAWVEITELDTLAAKSAWQETLNPPVTQGGKSGIIDLNKHRSGAIVATVDGNTINIKTSRVKRISLYLSGDMFNLDKQISLVINGSQYLNFKLKADQKTILEEFIRTRDRSFIVSNKVELTIR